LFQYFRAIRDDPTHAASRVRNVAAIPGNEMQVKVRHRLPGCGSVVDAKIECMRRVPLADDSVRLICKTQHGLALACRGLEPRSERDGAGR
jgi:hypothetical protein